MNIREAIEKFPTPGSVKTVEVPDLGTLHIKRLSYGELIKLPSEDRSLHVIQASVVDEAGKPLFADVEQVRSLNIAVGAAILERVTEVNTVNLQTAAKN